MTNRIYLFTEWSETNKAKMDWLVGKTLVRAEQQDNDKMVFETDSGEIFEMFHSQDCCESVEIESVVGDLSDLIGHPITLAEEVLGETPADYKFEYEPDSYTWTFYKFATIKGYVDVRWLGESNGYYSESVDIIIYRPT